MGDLHAEDFPTPPRPAPTVHHLVIVNCQTWGKSLEEVVLGGSAAPAWHGRHPYREIREKGPEDAPSS